MRKFNKKVVALFERYIDNEQFEVIVLLDGDYYNVHIISEKYKKDEMNTLQLQEPKENIDDIKKYFSDSYMIARLMDFFIWDRFYTELQNNNLQAYVTIEEE